MAKTQSHQWFYIKIGLLGASRDEIGPLTEAEFKTHIRKGKVTLSTEVMSPTRTKGNWRAANSMPSLVKAIGAASAQIEAAKQEQADTARQRKEEKKAAKHAAQVERENAKRAKFEAEQATAERTAAAVAVAPAGAVVTQQRVVTQQPVSAPTRSQGERTLYDSHPSMFGTRPVLFMGCVLLCFVGIGVPILIVWYISNAAIRLTITTERTTLRHGLLSKTTNEVWHRDVRNVRMHQSFLQRFLNVGYIGIASAGQGITEIEVTGMPRPAEIKHLVDECRR